MKLLLALLLLTIPLASHAAAYRWVDENGNVRFGSKPPPAPSVAAEKSQPKPPAKQSGKPADIKMLRREAQPATAPAPAPGVRQTERPSSPARNPQPARPAGKAVSVDSVKAPRAEPPKPAVRKLPALPSTPPPKARPAPTPPPKASAPPASQPARATQKAAPKKKQETAVKAATKADKKVGQTPVSKPAKKKPAAEQKTARKQPAPKPAETETEASIDKNAELCGMFTTFVSDYQNKLIGCEGPSCTIFERTLANYEKKKQTYCR